MPDGWMEGESENVVSKYEAPVLPELKGFNESSLQQEPLNNQVATHLPNTSSAESVVDNFLELNSDSTDENPVFANTPDEVVGNTPEMMLGSVGPEVKNSGQSFESGPFKTPQNTTRDTFETSGTSGYLTISPAKTHSD